MRSDLKSALLAAAAAAAVWAMPAAAEPFRYEGVCEASAAVALDDTHFVVASDDLEHLTVYERGKASPGASVELDDVTDIEAAARIGDTIFWLTSHSLTDKKGKDKPERKLLFATVVAPDGSLRLQGTEFRDLRERLRVLLSLDSAAFARTLNIEGLAATPSGDLLVGLRSPLRSDDRALIVRIADPFALVGLPPPPPAADAQPVADVSALDLGKRGVRSLERIGERYLIVAGSVEDGGKPPAALFWWDGAQGIEPGPDVSLTGLTPEALFAWGDGTLQILGDNGGNCDETDEKPKWFPSVEVMP
jgi:hypothetical protein